MLIFWGCITDEEGDTTSEPNAGSGTDSDSGEKSGKDEVASVETDSDFEAATEGDSATDSDSADNAAWNEEDEDGDGIKNGIEGKDDADGDNIPNYLDDDSDGDGIPDTAEGNGDVDHDGAPNFLDTDSDGNSILDRDEAVDPDNPLNSDKDDIPDYIDLDDDNDGLSDKDENSAGTDRLDKDTDGDGSDDLAEIVYNDKNPGGADPLDPDKKIPDHIFYVVLPYNAPENVTRELGFSTKIDKVDVAVTIDLSGSMGQEMNNLRQGIKDKLIKGIQDGVPGLDLAFGFSHFQDWKQDMGFKLDLPMTSDMSAVYNFMESGNFGTDGGDEPHSEALYQMSTGEGLQTKYFSGGFSCDQAIMTTVVNIPKIDCSGNEGTRGGMCFRDGAMPIYIMITDEGFEDIITYEECLTKNFFEETPDGWWPKDNAQGHGIDDAIAAISGTGGKFIGIDSSCRVVDDQSGDPLTDPQNCPELKTAGSYAAKEGYEKISEETASVHRETGEKFIYTIGNDGTGLSKQVADAVVELTKFIQMDVTTKGESEELCDGKDANSFIVGSMPLKGVPDAPLGFEKKDGSTFYKVNPGTDVTFDIQFHNNFCINKTMQPRLIKSKIYVVGDGAPLSFKEVQIIIPATPQS